MGETKAMNQTDHVGLLKSMPSKPGKPDKSLVLLDWQPQMHVALKAMGHDIAGVRAFHKQFPANVKRAMLLLRRLAGEELSEKDAANVLKGLAKAAPRLNSKRPLVFIRDEEEQSRPLTPSYKFRELALLFGTESDWDEVLAKELLKSPWASIDVGASYLKTLPLAEFVALHRKKRKGPPTMETLQLLQGMPVSVEEYRDVCQGLGPEPWDGDWLKYLRLLGIAKSMQGAFDGAILFEWLAESSSVANSSEPLVMRIVDDVFAALMAVPGDGVRQAIRRVLTETQNGGAVTWLVARMQDKALFEEALLLNHGAWHFSHHATVFGEGALTVGLRAFRTLRAMLPVVIVPFSGAVRPGTEEWTWHVALRLLNGLLEDVGHRLGDLSAVERSVLNEGVAHVGQVNTSHLRECLRRVSTEEAASVVKAMASTDHRYRDAPDIAAALSLSPEVLQDVQLRVLDRIVNNEGNSSYADVKSLLMGRLSDYALHAAPQETYERLMEKAAEQCREAFLLRALAAFGPEYGDDVLRRIFAKLATDDIPSLVHELPDTPEFAARMGRLLGGTPLRPAIESTLLLALRQNFSVFAETHGGLEAKNWFERLRGLAGEENGRSIHLLESTYRLGDVESPRGPNSWSVLGGDGPLIDAPTFRAEPMDHVLTIDLREAVSFQEHYPDARAVSVYVPKAESGEHYSGSKLVPILESVGAPGGEPLHVLSIPEPLGPLREVLTQQLMRRGSWIGGEAVHIQDPRDRGDFLMQLSEDMGLNCGDCGSVYFYSSNTHMECH